MNIPLFSLIPPKVQSHCVMLRLDSFVLQCYLFFHISQGCIHFLLIALCLYVLQVAVLGKGNTFQINASPSEDIHVLVIAGVPLKEAIARHGPFVMNTWEEIEQAFSDFQSGKLGSIAGSEERYAKTQRAVSKQKESGTWNKK